VKVYNSDGIVERQVAGETVMHEQWSGKALATRSRNRREVRLSEGRRRCWMDNVAVPSTAPNVRERQEVPELPDGSAICAAAEYTATERPRRVEQVPVAGHRRIAEFNPPAI